jgi:hypothetical protein
LSDTAKPVSRMPASTTNNHAICRTSTPSVPG